MAEMGGGNYVIWGIWSNCPYSGNLAIWVRTLVDWDLLGVEDGDGLRRLPRRAEKIRDLEAFG